MSNKHRDIEYVRKIYVALESPLINLLHFLPDIENAIPASDSEILIHVKKLNTELKKLDETYYIQKYKTSRMGRFQLFIKKWSFHEHPPIPVTPRQIKTIETELGSTARLPEYYKESLVAFGIPASISPELCNRAKDCKQPHLGIKKFLNPAEVIDISKKIRKHTHKNNLIALAADENDNFLCLQDTEPARKRSLSDPDAEWGLNLAYICNKKDFSCKDILLQSFYDWIKASAQIQKLNTSVKTYDALDTPIKSIILISQEIQNSEYFKKQHRYTSLFSGIFKETEHIARLYQNGREELGL